MVRIDFFTKKDAEYSDYMRYIIANTLQEYEGEVTLNQIPEKGYGGGDIQIRY